MSTILENLRKYFQTKSPDEIEKDWAELAMFDQVGPTIDEFITQSKLLIGLDSHEPDWEFSCGSKELKNPKFSSDFFLTLN